MLILTGFLIHALVLVPPFWFLLPRAGISPGMALFAAVPVGAVVLLWILAIRNWPCDGASGRF